MDKKTLEAFWAASPYLFSGSPDDRLARSLGIGMPAIGSMRAIEKLREESWEEFRRLAERKGMGELLALEEALERRLSDIEAARVKNEEALRKQRAAVEELRHQYDYPAELDVEVEIQEGYERYAERLKCARLVGHLRLELLRNVMWQLAAFGEADTWGEVREQAELPPERMVDTYARIAHRHLSSAASLNELYRRVIGEADPSAADNPLSKGWERVRVAFDRAGFLEWDKNLPRKEKLELLKKRIREHVESMYKSP